jgi:molecular chaperone GrpE
VTDEHRQQPQHDPAGAPPAGRPPAGETPAGPAGDPVAGNGAEVPQAEVPEGTPDDVARLERERDEYLDALQRLKAEFENFRRRTAREREGIALGATRDVVRDLLPVMDNLERAVAALGDQGEGIVAGLEMVRGQLAALLQGHGVEEIPAHGEAFDPAVHEAVASVPSADHDDGAVIEVVEKGYRHVEHVLRPTRVVVASRPQQ